MKAHIVINGVVVNTINVKSLDDLPNLITAENGGTIGDLWDGETFTTTPAVIPVPQTISPFQAKAVLLQSGLLDEVETYMADPATEAITKLAWQTAQEFRRDSPTVAGVAALLNLTSQDLDDMFIIGATIKA